MKHIDQPFSFLHDDQQVIPHGIPNVIKHIEKVAPVCNYASLTVPYCCDRCIVRYRESPEELSYFLLV